MAIYGYYGKPGSGKSYSVVANVIKPALEKGRTVFTNIPLTDECISIGGRVVQFENDVKPEYFATIDKGAVLVADEAWRYAPAGQRSDKMSDDFKNFLAMHRHMVDEKGNSTQIYLVTQTPAQLNSFVKGLIDSAFNISKKSGAGITQFRTDVYSGVAAEKCKGDMDRQFFSSFDPKVYKLYKSSTMADTEGAANEEGMDSRGGIMSNWFIKWGVPLSVVFVGFGGWFGYQAISNIGGGTIEPDPVASTSQPSRSGRPSVQVNNVEVAKPKQPVLSKTMRVSGYTSISGPTDSAMVHVVHSNGALFNVPMSICSKLFDTYKCIIDGEIVTTYSGKQEEDDPVTVMGNNQPALSNPFESI